MTTDPPPPPPPPPHRDATLGTRTYEEKQAMTTEAKRETGHTDGCEKQIESWRQRNLELVRSRNAIHNQYRELVEAAEELLAHRWEESVGVRVRSESMARLRTALQRVRKT